MTTPPSSPSWTKEGPPQGRERRKPRREVLVLAAGGTGGHVYPALALAAFLSRATTGSDPDAPLPNRMDVSEGAINVHIITDARGARFLEGESSPSASTMRCPDDKGRRSREGGQGPLSPSGNFTILLKENLGNRPLWYRALKLLPTTWKAMCILRRLRPRMVMGFGGYPSFPTCLAAILTRTPLFLHEQNAVLGKVNRFFTRWCQQLLLSFPDTLCVPKSALDKTAVTGNFIRQNLLGATKNGANSKGPFNIVAIGGSQGSAALAQLVVASISDLPDSIKARLHLTLQAPETHRPQIQASWPSYACDPSTADHKRSPIAGTLRSFYNDMPSILKDAHVVIARSGASTVWELIAMGRPGIFLPLPTSADNHQYANANFLVSRHAGWLLSGEASSPEMLRDLLAELFENPRKIQGAVAALSTLRNHLFNPLPQARAEVILNKFKHHA